MGRQWLVLHSALQDHSHSSRTVASVLVDLADSVVHMVLLLVVIVLLLLHHQFTGLHLDMVEETKDRNSLVNTSNRLNTDLVLLP